MDKISYLKDLNVDAILLSSVLESEHGPFSDYGYEITNYTAIHSTYGTVDDLQRLISAAHNESTCRATQHSFCNVKRSSFLLYNKNKLTIYIYIA